MRLIDADAICREIARKRNKGELDFSPEIELMLIDIIMEQPTSYDVETVVEQILNITVNLFAGRSNGKTLFAKTLSEYRRMVVDIVKEGGLNDTSNN